MTWLLGILLGFGICLAALYVFDVFAKRRTLRTLAESCCPKCGTRYGFGAARAAREAHAAACAESRRQHPGARINFSREWKAYCPRCKTMGMYHIQTCELRLVGESEEAQA